MQHLLYTVNYKYSNYLICACNSQKLVKFNSTKYYFESAGPVPATLYIVPKAEINFFPTKEM